MGGLESAKPLMLRKETFPKISCSASEHVVPSRRLGCRWLWFTSLATFFTFGFALFFTIICGCRATSFFVLLSLFLLQLGESLFGHLSVWACGSLLFCSSTDALFTLSSLLSADLVRQYAHSTRLAVRDKIEDHFLVDESGIIHVVEASPFKLEVAALWKSLDDAFSNSNIFKSRVSVEDLLDVILLLNLRLIDQVIEFFHADLHSRSRIVADPGNLGRALKVLITLINCREKLKAVTVLLTACDRRITPFHECEFCADLEVFCIIALDDQVFTVHDSFVAYGCILGMQGLRASFQLLRTIFNGQLDAGCLSDASIARYNRIQNLLVDRPDFVPLHINRVF